jgi:predicted MFS family arabinose efflux permease
VTTSSPPSPSSTASTVTLLAVAAFFSGAAMRVCDGLLPRIGGDFGLTPGAAGGVILFFSVAYGLSQVVFGPLGDRFGKARLVCFGLLACMVMALVAAASADFPLLLLTRAAWGMAAAGIIPLSMAWIGDAVPYEERQATLAKLLMGILTGMMSGQLLGGLFADTQAGWRGAFVLMAMGYGLIGFLLLLRLRGIAVAAPSTGRGTAMFIVQLRMVLSQPWSGWVLGVAFAEGVLLMGPLAFLPAYLNQRFGLTLAAASALLALYAVGGLVYALFARRIVLALGEPRMVRVGGFLMGVGFLSWWLSPWAWTAGIVAWAVGFGTYLFHNTLQTHATQMTPAARGTAVSVFSSCLFLGQAVGVALAGYAFDQVGHAALLVVPALGLPLTGWLFARALQRRAT